jgi:hypothetical protein
MRGGWKLAPQQLCASDARKKKNVAKKASNKLKAEC